MKGLNKVVLMGNVGRDPEVRNLDANSKVCTFSLATSDSYLNKAGEKITQTDWHNIVAWRGLADVIEKYVHKGDPLYVEGTVRYRSYPDKENPAVLRYVTDIVASDIRLLNRGTGSADTNYSQPPVNSYTANQSPAGNVATESTQAAVPNPAQMADDGDDLPF
ncbi:MAG: hypothetical protein RIS47_1992 [Bacteroidota bacterium]|jgi:single-strand DNA-binding protein